MWHSFWLWVFYNSPTVQAAATAVGVPLLGATLWGSLRAAKAAEKSANQSRRQAAVAMLAADSASAPLLILSWERPTQEDPFVASNVQYFRIINVGLGPALDISMFLTLTPDKSLYVRDNALGPGKSFPAACSDVELGMFGLTIRYYSSHRREHRCIVKLDSGSLEYGQRHERGKLPSDNVAEEL